jgi:hypothetical protein
VVLAEWDDPVIEPIRHLRIAGAMGIGKSTVSDALAGRLPGCVVIHADMLGVEMVSTQQPEPDYERFHDVLLRLALQISFSGVTVLYQGCVLPRQVESCPLYSRFDVRWLALVADSETRLQRALGRGDEVAHYKSWRMVHDSLDAELRLAALSNPRMRLLDTAAMTPEDFITVAESWATTALAD